ncbi:SDR family oxidoreductase [Nonomuraea sp. CA-218870]|uniref:SDR family oxidoreductase n=1 Tax=Nonomuraea sp. CA-218870 TaxID=3239998 RepID=UPI003D8D7F82
MTGRIVLITGATSGIGAHTARLLLDRGHRVAVTGRDETKLKSFLDETGHPDRLLGIIAAAADWPATQAAVTRTVAHFGALHPRWPTSASSPPTTHAPSPTATRNCGRPWSSPTSSAPPR